MSQALSWSLQRGDAGELLLRRDGGEASEGLEVQATCCFPWSQPRAFISLRDAKGTEQVFVAALTEVSAETRALIEQDLAARNFIPEILAIERIDEDKELFVWQVRTHAGPRTFLTQRRDHLRQLASGAVLLRDVAHDVYMIRQPKALDRKSLALIWVHLD